MLRSRGRSAARVLLALGLLVPTVALSGSAHASFPGTNGKIFITSNLGTPGTDIYSINPDGTGLKRLTTGAANDSFAAVSPSGKRVAFVSERDGNPEIYVMNADGSGQARLTNNPGRDLDPAWSPDGKKIAFDSDRDGNSEIYVMGADGSSPTRLTTSTSKDVIPSWAPNGSKIAFTTDRAGNNEIDVMNPDGTGVTDLTNNTADDIGSSWSPDSKEIAFASKRDGNYEVYVMGADGTAQARVTTSPGFDGDPAWSPDGTEMIVDSDRSGTVEVWLFQLAQPTTPPTQVTHTPAGDFSSGGGESWGPSTPPSCPATVIKGRLQPVQADWADDPFWRDRKLRNKLVADGGTHTDDFLPMVQGKPSLLFGYEEAKGDQEQRSHYEIFIRGRTTGTTAVPVKMKFSSDQTTPGVIQATSVLKSINLDPPCAPQHPKLFQVTLEVPQGVPLKAGTFTFPSTGDYTITDELVRGSGDPTGLRIDVNGSVVATVGPTVGFVPAILSSATAHDHERLKAKAELLEQESKTFIPDFYPLVPGGLPTVLLPEVDVSKARVQAAQDYQKWMNDNGFASESKLKTFREQAIIAALTSRFGFGPSQASTVQRLMVVVRGIDLELLTSGAAAWTPTQKLMFMDRLEDYDTVAHELAHTMPYLWSKHQMVGECGFDYHNVPKLHVANGYRVTRGGVEHRERRDGTFSIMGSSGLPSDQWTDLCTYWQLVHVLQNPPDPPAILVQGRLARSGKKVIGQLLPAYQVDAPADLTAKASGGSWAIVLKDASDQILARYPFFPPWALVDTTVNRNLLSFSYRVEDPGGVAKIDLIGPHGLLDERVESAAAPTVSITSPTEGTNVPAPNGVVQVTWAGSDTDGDPLLYSVVYSPDGGASWYTEAFDTTATSVDVQVPPGVHEQIVRVYATDGTKSAEATVHFTT